MLNKNLCAIWELTETVTPLTGSCQAGSQGGKGQVDRGTQPFQEAVCSWQSLEKTKFSFANLILLLYKPPLRASPIPISRWPAHNQGYFGRLFISCCFFRHSLSYWSFVSILCRRRNWKECKSQKTEKGIRILDSRHDTISVTLNLQ